MSFFERYTSFEDRVNAAIDAGDAKLVQVFLGPKYCQLWQYWLVHGIIASKALKMERITHSRLFLDIIEKQEKVLQEQKELLEERKKYLVGNDTENIQASSQASNIKKSRNFLRDLLIATKDAAVKCRQEIVEESNRTISYSKFYIPHNLLSDQDSGANDLEYVMQQISTISSAEALSLTNEVDDVIDEINKQINSNIWEQSDISTRASYYLSKLANQIEEGVGGENGRLLDQVINVVPENVEVKGKPVPIKALINGILVVLRLFPSGALKLTESTCDNMNSLACVEGNLKEIERFVTKIGEVAQEKQDLSDKLIAIYNKIESQVIERMNDGKFRRCLQTI